MRPFPTRALALVSTALLVLVAACGEEDPIAPGLGIENYESGTITGTFSATDTGQRVSPAIIANLSRQLNVRMCHTEGENLDLIVTSGRATDTVAANRSSTEECETVTVPVIEGRTYRFRVRSLTGPAAYVICYAYDQATCQALAAFEPDTGGVPQGYYLTTEGKTGAALLDALHSVIRSGHNGFEYDTARGYLYQDVEDPDDNNLLEDLYAGRIATVDRRANSNTDAIDAQFNAEHIWPQSCGARLDRTNGFRSTGPRGDLHIIAAADASANNSRSNFPYGVVTGTPDATFGPDSAGNFSRRGANAGRTVFEPRAEKRGDIARAIFYFYVRYVPEIPDRISLENFVVEEATLLQWAQQDPPDAFERARNNEVYAVQGNRNPFVDRPELLTRLGDFPNTATGAHATCDF